VSKQLAEGCCPIEEWHGRDVNTGPVGLLATEFH